MKYLSGVRQLLTQSNPWLRKSQQPIGGSGMKNPFADRPPVPTVSPKTGVASSIFYSAMYFTIKNSLLLSKQVPHNEDVPSCEIVLGRVLTSVSVPNAGRDLIVNIVTARLQQQIKTANNANIEVAQLTDEHANYLPVFVIYQPSEPSRSPPGFRASR
jgi:hypothetical protein